MAQKSQSRGGYNSGFATKDAIIMAAMRLMAANGIRGFSLRDLAKEVGISHPAVIYHFPTKEALVTAVVYRFEQMEGLYTCRIDEVTGRLADVQLVPHDLYEFIIGLMLFSAQPEAKLLRDFECSITAEASHHDHPAHGHAIGRQVQMSAFMFEQVKELSNDLDLDLRLKPEATAKAIINHWHGLLIDNRYLDGDDAVTEMIADFLAVLGHVLRLPADFFLNLGASIPEECSEVFARVVKRFKEVAA